MVILIEAINCTAGVQYGEENQGTRSSEGLLSCLGWALWPPMTHMISWYFMITQDHPRQIAAWWMMCQHCFPPTYHDSPLKSFSASLFGGAGWNSKQGSAQGYVGPVCDCTLREDVATITFWNSEHAYVAIEKCTVLMSGHTTSDQGTTCLNIWIESNMVLLVSWDGFQTDVSDWLMEMSQETQCFLPYKIRFIQLYGSFTTDSSKQGFINHNVEGMLEFTPILSLLSPFWRTAPCLLGPNSWKSGIGSRDRKNGKLVAKTWVKTRVCLPWFSLKSKNIPHGFSHLWKFWKELGRLQQINVASGVIFFLRRLIHAPRYDGGTLEMSTAAWLPLFWTLKQHGLDSLTCRCMLYLYMSK